MGIQTTIFFLRFLLLALKIRLPEDDRFRFKKPCTLFLLFFFG
jgi:hypothetical protein